MSKSKVAMIALAILLVLSLVLTATGAWYTDHDSAGADAQVMTFGKFGDIQITVTGAEWTEHAGGANALTDVSDRNYIMPGDRVVSDTVTISYSPDDTDGEGNGQNLQAYYVVKMGNKAYKIDSGAWVDITSTAEADTIGESDLEVQGIVATVTYDNITYALDGVVSGAAASGNKHSFEIPNEVAYSGTSGAPLVISFAGAEFGSDGTAVTYEVRIIQTANLSAAQAYALLMANAGQDYPTAA